MKLFRTRFNLRRVVATIILVALLLLPILSLFGGSVQASTQAGQADGTYTSSSTSTSGILLQSTGSVLVSEGSTVKRFTSAGLLDGTFTTGSAPNGINAIGLSDKFYGTNNTTPRILRFNANGTVDSTWSLATNTGRAYTTNSIIEASDGSVFAAMATTPYLYKFSSTGALNTAFDTNVKLSTPGRPGYSVALQSDGKVLVGTDGGVLKRYSSSGVYDNTFTPTSGIGVINAIQVVSDGIVVGTNSSPYLRKYSFSGSLDSAFASALGSSLNNAVNDIAVQSNGKLIVGGSFAGRVFRLSTGGVTDTAFNSRSASSITSSVNSIAIQSDDNILVATDNGVRRLLGSNVAPGAPLAPTAVASDRSAIVTVAAGSGATPTGYTVYVNGDVSKNCVVTGSSGNCTVSGLTNGTAYTFYAVAQNVDVNSVNSPNSNSVTPADIVAPIISTAVLDSLGTKLTLTYDEPLGTTTAGTNAFTVTAGGSNVVVSSVSVSGSTVELGLASVIGQGLTVTVS